MMCSINVGKELEEGEFDEADGNINNNSKGLKVSEVRREKGDKSKSLKSKTKSMTNNLVGASLVSQNLKGLNKEINKVKDEIIVKPLNIIYFNARSIRNKMDELKILISEVKPDIVGIVETWLTEENFDSEIEIDDYNFIRKDRKSDTKSIGGGIIIYFKWDISLIDLTNGYNSNIDHIWGKVIMKNSKNRF